MNTPTLETMRLILRKFTESDMDALFLILQDKEVNTFLPWYPLKSIGETKKFYEERYASKYSQSHSDCIRLIWMAIKIEFIKNIGILLLCIL